MKVQQGHIVSEVPAEIIHQVLMVIPDLQMIMIIVSLQKILTMQKAESLEYSLDLL